MRFRLSATSGPFEADQVQRVTVRLAPPVATIVDNRDIPDICLQQMIAVMLLDKTVSFRGAHDKPRMEDPAALRQRGKVNLVYDEELAKLLPVRVAGGRDRANRRKPFFRKGFSAVRGTPRNPMTRTEVIDKSPRSHGTGPRTRKSSEKLIETVFAIETITGRPQLAVAPSARANFSFGRQTFDARPTSAPGCHLLALFGRGLGAKLMSVRGVRADII